MSGLPKVTVLSLGGTIASAPGSGGGRASPVLSANDIIASVPGLTGLAELELKDVARLPSIDVTFELAMAVADLARDADRSGSTGVVVTQGTDTLEEMAFCLDLLFEGEMPIAMTGAMRHSGLVGNDGPANLLDAVRTVTSPFARGLGCLVVLNEEIHSARAVRKMHTSSPGAFQSPSVGPLGWIVEGVPHLRDRPFPRVTITPPRGAAVVRPPLVKIVFDDDGWWIPRIREMGARGLVLEAMGGGHVPSRLCESIAELASSIPVLLTSRTGSGEVLRATYGGFPGSETWLIDAGLIPAGSLDSLKARVLLGLLLTEGASRERIESVVATLGSPARSA
jgi:L-asparaginase/archaeal Glu-tRNAGln amidotransferase subunit D